MRGGLSGLGITMFTSAAHPAIMPLTFSGSSLRGEKWHVSLFLLHLALPKYTVKLVLRIRGLPSITFYVTRRRGCSLDNMTGKDGFLKEGEELERHHLSPGIVQMEISDPLELSIVREE